MSEGAPCECIYNTSLSAICEMYLQYMSQCSLCLCLISTFAPTSCYALLPASPPLRLKEILAEALALIFL